MIRLRIVIDSETKMNKNESINDTINTPNRITQPRCSAFAGGRSESKPGQRTVGQPLVQPLDGPPRGKLLAHLLAQLAAPTREAGACGQPVECARLFGRHRTESHLQPPARQQPGG